MKKQIVYLTGGEDTQNYGTYYDFLHQLEYNPYEEKIPNWNKNLAKNLGKNYDFLRVPIRESSYADYKAWKIMFEKIFPYLREDFILIVTSLGGSFILKYMIETGFPKKQNLKISKLFFVAPALRDTPDETLGSFRVEVEKLKYIEKPAKQIYIYYSTDDKIVPYEQSLELATYFPDIIIREFSDKGHFFGEERIKELETDIKS